MATADQVVMDKLEDYGRRLTSDIVFLQDIRQIYHNAIDAVRPGTTDENIAYGDDDFRWNRFYAYDVCVALDSEGAYSIHIHTDVEVPHELAEHLHDEAGLRISLVPGRKSCVEKEDIYK